MSRYYRAPEIILGTERGQPLDVWSIGCCLYEMYTGEILFRKNKDNNGLLYEIMKVCCGAIFDLDIISAFIKALL